MPSQNPTHSRRRTVTGLAAAVGLLAWLAAPPVAAQHEHGADDQPAQHSGHAHPASGAGQGGEAADPHAHHRQMMEHAGAGAAPQEAGQVRVPDVAVVDADGRPLHFYSDLVEGKTVAMNFVFTTCTTICPPMGANFAKLQKLLGDRAGRDVHLISVSVDPVTDTPERMKAWGEKFGAGAGWTLVTGERDQVTTLLKALGVFTPDINDHAPVVLVGDDAQQTWTRTYGLAPPATLVEVIDQVAAGRGGGDG
jgi:protein SCO1/2